MLMTSTMVRLTMASFALGAALASASASAAGPANVDKKFHGGCTTQFQITGGTPPVADILITLDCVFSHLGRTDGVAPQVVNFATGTLTATPTYVAANGDTLKSTVVGTLRPDLAATLCPGELAFSGTETYQPTGTGRFAHAGGSSTFVGCATPPDANGSGTGFFTTTGTLTY